MQNGRERTARAFAARARHEAARYGSDPWVFVRELLQNARDAGARQIGFRVHCRNGIERVECRDDGEGLGFAEARRYLFALYASSKENRSDQAGRFGVGFWSVLRFEPTRIRIASRPGAGRAWAVELDGELTRAERVPPAPGTPAGTTVLLERPARDRELARRIGDAVDQSARDLRQRDHPGSRIDVAVNGRPCNRPLSLPAPASRFRSGRLRGVVGLGPAPAVELFSLGLRVRSAAVLGDLLGPGHRASSHTRVRFPELIEGVAPRALLEGGSLDLTLARSDAKETRSLRRLVKLAQRELAHLVERQLEHADTRTFGRRAWQRAPLVAVFAAGALLAGAGAWMLQRSPAPVSDLARGPAPVPARPVSGYRDLHGAYAGPAVHGTQPDTARGPIRYAPGRVDLYLAALRVSSLDAAGRPVHDGGEHAPRAAGAFRCVRDCVDLALTVADGPGLLRLPVATGHAVEPDSVRLGAEPVALLVDSQQHPAIRLDAGTVAELRYRSGPVRPAAAAARVLAAAPALPPALAAAAEALRAIDPQRRVAAALHWVAGAVRYSLDPEVTRRHAAAAATPFLERAVAIGAGDCDVQNGVLLSLLQASRIDARLAVGYVGRGGASLPDLHAWVEYRLPGGAWSAADASVSSSAYGSLRGSAPPPAAVASAPAPATPPHAAGARALWPIGALAALVATAGLILVRGARVERSLRIDPRPDLAALLRGALQRPDAFRDTPGVFRRPLLPLADGRQVSLAAAWEQAHRGRLFAAERGNPLARAAARAGGSVLDAGSHEAGAVAEMLGAVPLELWLERLRGARVTPLLSRLAAHLAARGEPWTLGLRADGGRGCELLDLAPPGRKGDRYALLDAAAPGLAAAAELARSFPALALFTAADAVAELLAFPATRRARLLAPLASAALLERR